MVKTESLSEKEVEHLVRLDYFKLTNSIAIADIQ